MSLVQNDYQHSDSDKYFCSYKICNVTFVTGLILVPNGESIGYALGDERPLNMTGVPSVLGPRSPALEEEHPNYHPWGVLFTVLGTVFLDFDADACQSPARAYLLDVTVPG
jgi:solute carrier family 45, member 1/2/4